MNLASHPHQLPLSLRLRSDSRFANFVATGANAVTLHALQQWLGQPQSPVFYLSGPPRSGRSHLLQAAAAETPLALYLPLREFAQAEPEAVCEGLEGSALLIFDDVDAVSEDRRWCEALFHLFNRQLAAEHRLLFSGQLPAAALACVLPDLRSRLGWGGSFSLYPLDDEGRLQLLQSRLAERGLVLTDDAAAYLLSQVPRDSASLVGLVDQLDRQSLVQQRRLTIPFIKSVIATTSSRDTG